MSKAKTVVLFTSRKRKYEEWKFALKTYGLQVEMQPYPPADPTNHGLLAILQRPDVLMACDEDSNLWLPDESALCRWEHLEPVCHISKVTAYQFIGGELKTTVVTGRKDGYLDLLNGGKTPDDWWDTAFRLNETNETYQEQSPKRSARDEALAQLFQRLLHFESLVARNFDMGTSTRPVDFQQLVSARVARNQFYRNPEAKRMGLEGLLNAALNRGLFDRHARNRPQQHLWETNFAGIPSVSKRDAFHESVFGFHDLIHMLLGEAIVVDENSKLAKQIGFLSRMHGEGVTLYTADGLLAESVRRTGFDYDYTARLALPFLIQDLGFLERTPDADELARLLRANCHFFVLGDLAPFEQILREKGSSGANFQAYADWYSVFSIKDAYWTKRNYTQLQRQAKSRRIWWEAIRPIREAYPELNLVSISDLIERIGKGDEELRAAESPEELGILLDRVLMESFNRCIRPFYQNENVHLVSPEVEQSRAFVRWLTGQLYLFAVFSSAPQSTFYMEQIVQTIVEAKRSSPAGIIPFRSVGYIRQLYEKFLNSLERMGRISSDEKLIWSDTFPHFPPFYLSYEPAKETTAEYCSYFLLEQSRRPEMDDVSPGAVVVMTDGERFIFQKKDDSHPNPRCRGTLSLFGGSCDSVSHVHAHELSWIGLFRELKEEIRHDRLVHEIYHKSVLWNSYVLPGNQFLGRFPLSAYLARVTPAELDVWISEMAKPGVVYEGVFELIASREQLLKLLEDTNNFIASLDIPIREILDSLSPAE